MSILLKLDEAYAKNPDPDEVQRLLQGGILSQWVHTRAISEKDYISLNGTMFIPYNSNENFFAGGERDPEKAARYKVSNLSTDVYRGAIPHICYSNLLQWGNQWWIIAWEFRHIPFLKG